jgi:hypothetical protein
MADWGELLSYSQEASPSASALLSQLCALVLAVVGRESMACSRVPSSSSAIRAGYSIATEACKQTPGASTCSALCRSSPTTTASGAPHMLAHVFDSDRFLTSLPRTGFARTNEECQ